MCINKNLYAKAYLECALKWNLITFNLQYVVIIIWSVKSDNG